MERPLEHRHIVIKVRHGDALRRFTCHVNGDFLDHNISTLRAKIIQLFKFSEDADLLFTYTDIDGDVVTLSNDDELSDAIIYQCLNPLRITVQVNGNTTTGNLPIDTNTTAPSKTMAGLEFLSPKARQTIEKSFEAIPEPLYNTLSKISEEVSKVSATVPVYNTLSKIYEEVSKVSATAPSPVFEILSPLLNHAIQESLKAIPESLHSTLPKISEEVSKVSATALSPVFEIPSPLVNRAVQETLQAIDEPLCSTLTKISEDVSKVAATAPIATDFIGLFGNLVQPGHDTSPGSPTVSRAHDCDSGNSFPPADLLSDPTLSPVVTLIDIPLEKKQPETGIETKLQKENDQSKGKAVAVSSSCTPVVDDQQYMGLSSEHATRVCNADLDVCKNQHEGSAHPYNFTDNGGVANQQTNLFPPIGCYGTWHHSVDFGPSGPAGFYDGSFPGVHRGVSCDGCGMHPIVGPRYKSKVQENFDLCNICFFKLANPSDYLQIDRPSVYHPPRLFKGFLGRHSSRTFRNCGTRHPREKLGSRFIQDVTIFDGTLIPPSTAFTKIWRIKNSGYTAWPMGTRLVLIGGDLLGYKGSIELEIPTTGFPPGEEIDVAVDLCSPSLVGYYISYWRLASPQGQKFGQRFWVHIQVEYGSGAAPFQFNPTTTKVGETNIQPTDEVQHYVADPPLVKPSSDVNSNGKYRSIEEVCLEGSVVSSVALPSTSSVSVLPETFKSAILNASWPILPETSVPSTVSGSVMPDPTPAVSGSVMPEPTSPPAVSGSIMPEPTSPAVSGCAVPEYPVGNFSLFPPVLETTGSSVPVGNDSSLISYPVVDTIPISSIAPPVVSSLASYPVISPLPSVVSGTPKMVILDDDTEWALLSELEEIGFKDSELNREILRNNEYDLEITVQDLCTIADWDPLLEDLVEMGFHDKQLNVKLLVKNGGSLKRTVLDLISGSNG